MFSRLRGFLSRHRRKFIVSGLIIGGVVVASRYAQKKFREWHERETKEFLERTRRQQHFESTERTCNQTIISLAPKLMESICKIIDTEDLVSQLRNGDPKKLEIWEELKVLAFTKASVIVYAFAMLVITLRIQLNLVGGYMFRDLNENSGNRSINSKVQENYLSSVHHFLGEGINELVSLIQSKVHYIMGGIPLKRRLNLNDTEQLFWALQAAVGSDKKDPSKKISHYVFSENASKTSELDGAEESVLNSMIIETLDVLENEEVMSLMSSLVSQGFSNVVDRIAEYFVPPEISKGSPSFSSGSIVVDQGVFQNGSVVSVGAQCSKELKNGHIDMTTFIHPNNLDMAMAKLIPIVNGLGHSRGQNVSDPWVQQLVINDRIKMLGANVYEAFGYKG